MSTPRGAEASARVPGGPAVPPPPGQPRSAWKALFFGLAAVAIIAGAGWALLGSRFLVVRSVQVTGTGPLVSRQRVLAAARITPGLPLIRVNTAAAARRIERITQVQSAQVSRDWPDTVVISIRPRTPVFAVAGPDGYGQMDASGVVVRQTRHRPPRLPLFTAGGTSLGSLRGSPAVRAAAVVLTELPTGIAHRVLSVSAATASDVTVQLTGRTVIVWGDTARPAMKARELALLMTRHARVYDVSGPGTAVTRG